MSDPEYTTQMDLLIAANPTLTFDLSEDIKDQFDRIVLPEVAAGFSRTLHLPEEDGRSILLQAVDAYIGGVIDRFNQRSEKQDNAALTKVAAKAEQLSDALLELIDHPNLEAQLESRIRGFHALANGPQDLTLPDLMGSNRNVFLFLRDMLIDLQTCSEDTRNFKPKREEFDEWFGHEGGTTADEQFALATAEWKRRSKARKLGADHPLLCFVMAILPHWQAHTSIPFTEAKYYREMEGYSSGVLPILKPILHCIDPTITDQQIAMAIRKTRQDQIA